MGGFVFIVILAVVLCMLIKLAARRRAYHRLHAEARFFGWHDDISPVSFEERCADAMRTAGWQARTTAVVGDQGVDVEAWRGGVTVVLQCKLYSKSVGNKAVQEALAGAVHRDADYAAVVTNADYTRSAQQLSETTGVKLLHFTDLRFANQHFGFPDIPPAPLDRSARRRPILYLERAAACVGCLIVIGLLAMFAKNIRPESIDADATMLEDRHGSNISPSTQRGALGAPKPTGRTEVMATPR